MAMMTIMRGKGTAITMFAEHMVMERIVETISNITIARIATV